MVPSVRIEPSESPTGPSPVVDGRTARGVRTRDAIVDACIALVDRGDLRPTAPRIAQQAGVSVRSVFQHFDDLETLFAAVGERVVQRLSRLIVPVDPRLPLDDRIERLVRQRALLLEVVTPVRRAAMVHSVGSAEISRMFEIGHRFLRQQVATVFGPELADAGDAAGDLLDGLDVALAWSTWDTLRQLGHRSEDDARRVQEWMVRAALHAVEQTRGRADGRGRGPSGSQKGEQERTSTASLRFSAPIGDESARGGRLSAEPASTEDAPHGAD